MRHIPRHRLPSLAFFLLAWATLSACGSEDAPAVERLECAPGTAGPECTPCEDGSYCPGGAVALSCGEGTWDDDGDPATPCVAWSLCSAGTYVDGEGSPTSDRTCKPCEAGTWSSGTNAAQCTDHAPCPAGTYVSVAGSTASDTQCSWCPSGTFSTTENATRCEAWTACPSGQRVSALGGATTDQACTECDEGTYTETQNASVCQPHGACPAGTRQVSPGTTMAPAECEPCATGTYCPGGSAEPQACPEGTWDHDGNPASACVPWTTCLAGQSQTAPGSGTADRECAPCEAGTFSTAENATSCTPWTNCDDRERRVANGSATTDHACEACPGGFIREGANVEICESALPFIQVSAGQEHSCGLQVDGTVWCWGRGDLLGNGSLDDSSVPLRVSALTDAVQVSAGREHSCAVKGDGTVWCWGLGPTGQLGNASALGGSIVPVQVLNLTDALQVSAGSEHSCAVLGDGTAWCWGFNAEIPDGSGSEYRLLGSGSDLLFSVAPLQVSDLTDALQISAGMEQSCAVRGDGTVWCWGRGGRLGDGSTLSSNTPVQVNTLTDVLQVSAGGRHSCAVQDDGTAWCWGDGNIGQLGNGDTLPGMSPLQVNTLTDTLQISAGDFHTCAVQGDGTLWCWGLNSSGTLGFIGNGDTATLFSSSPMQVSDLMDAAQVSANESHTCAVQSDGKMWCWGDGSLGRLGNGSLTNSSVPVPVSEPTDAP